MTESYPKADNGSDGEYRPDKDLVYGLERSSPYGKSNARMLGEKMPSLTIETLGQLGLEPEDELLIIDDFSDKLDERRLYLMDGPGDSGTTQSITSESIKDLG